MILNCYQGSRSGAWPKVFDSFVEQYTHVERSKLSLHRHKISADKM